MRLSRYKLFQLVIEEPFLVFRKSASEIIALIKIVSVFCKLVRFVDSQNYSVDLFYSF